MSRRWRAPTAVAAAAVVIFALSLVARVGSIDVYVTADEGNWMERTALFSAAIARGDAAGTYLTGHPGVMTMWAGLLGMGFERAAHLARNLHAGNIAADQPAYFEALVRGRLPLMLLTCLATVATALLAWRMFGALPGMLSGALLALEPFWIGHSLVLHLDASLTSYITVSAYAGLLYWWQRGRPTWLALSAVFAAFALLSKTPGVFIVAFVPFVAGLALLRDPGRRLLPRAWLRVALELVVWLTLAALAMLAVWPAMRVNPLGTLLAMAAFTEGTGGTDHANYFLNDTTGAPGLLYYPVTLALRLSPVTQIGLLLALVALALRLRQRRWSGLGLPLMLGAFCALFVVMMDLAPKKFDRYLLPIYPTLVLLAGLGYTWLVRLARPRLGDLATTGALALALLAQLSQSAGTRPYFMAYYNPLLGGAPAARDTIVVGWGEGMDVVARYLDQLPNADSLTVATFYNSVFAAQFRGNIMSPNTYQPVSADYALLYVNVSQRSLADRLRAAIREREPFMAVRINGLEYVTAYRIEDDSVGTAVPAEFGRVVRLERYRLENAGSQPGQAVTGLLRWKLVGPPPSELQTALALVRTDGWVAYQVQVPLGGDRPLLQWRQGDETVLSYTYVVPPDLPIGRYRLLATVRDPSSGRTLPLTAPPPANAPRPDGYQDAVVLATFQSD